MVDEQSLGMCFKCSEDELRAKYPGDSLRIAGLGALEKGDNTFRIIHDGTHGVNVNKQTQPRDRIRMPGPPELKAVLGHAAEHNQPLFLLTLDVRKAHRRFKNAERDWGLQCCRLQPPGLW
eukprot:11208723-Lingulodinium_polyedra.AAC.1